MCHTISVQLTAEYHNNKKISVITRWQWRVRKLCSYTRWKHELVGANVLFTTLLHYFDSTNFDRLHSWLKHPTHTVHCHCRSNNAAWHNPSTRGYLSRLMMTLFNGGTPRPQWINKMLTVCFIYSCFAFPQRGHDVVTQDCRAWVLVLSW